MKVRLERIWGAILIAASVVGAFCIVESSSSLFTGLFLALLDLLVGLIGCRFVNIKSK